MTKMKEEYFIFPEKDKSLYSILIKQGIALSALEDMNNEDFWYCILSTNPKALNKYLRNYDIPGKHDKWINNLIEKNLYHEQKITQMNDKEFWTIVLKNDPIAIFDYIEMLMPQEQKDKESSNKKEDIEIDNLLKRVRNKLDNEIFKIENRSDISDDEKVEKIIKTFSASCAAIATQPIPFADIFVLTPIQAFMGTRIGSIRGVPVSEAKATEIIKELGSVVGLGLLAQQLVIGAYKFIPYWGIITTIPMVYGLTYAIGKVMDNYFMQKFRKGKFDPEEIKNLWEETLKRQKKEAKSQKETILEKSKDYES